MSGLPLVDADDAAGRAGTLLAAARRGRSTDTRTAAVLALAVAVARTRGGVDDGELDAARAAGLTDAEIAETIGHVGLNVRTNYLNKAGAVDVDFPHVAA